MPLAMVPIVVPVSSTLSACGVTFAGSLKVRHGESFVVGGLLAISGRRNLS